MASPTVVMVLTESIPRFARPIIGAGYLMCSMFMKSIANTIDCVRCTHLLSVPVVRGLYLRRNHPPVLIQVRAWYVFSLFSWSDVTLQWLKSAWMIVKVRLADHKRIQCFRMLGMTGGTGDHWHRALIVSY